MYFISWSVHGVGSWKPPRECAPTILDIASINTGDKYLKIAEDVYKVHVRRFVKNWIIKSVFIRVILQINIEIL